MISNNMDESPRIFDNQYLNLAKAAAYLGIAISSLNYLAKRKKAVPYALLGKEKVFHKKDLDRLFKEHRIIVSSSTGGLL